MSILLALRCAFPFLSGDDFVDFSEPALPSGFSQSPELSLLAPYPPAGSGVGRWELCRNLLYSEEIRGLSSSLLFSRVEGLGRVWFSSLC